MPWSDWQEPWVAPFDGPDVHAGQAVAREMTQTEDTPFDAATWLADARATIMAGGGTSIDAIAGTGLTIFMASLGGENSGHSSATLQLGYIAANYRVDDVTDTRPNAEPPGVPDSADFPPDSEFDDPTYGPYIAGRIGYEAAPRQGFVQWGTGGAFLQNYREFQTSAPTSAELTNPFTDTPPQITYSLLTALAADAWPSYPAGTVLATDDAHVDGTFETIINHSQTPSFTLDGITDTDIWLVAQPSFLDNAVDLPYGDVITSGSEWGSRFINGNGNLGGPGPFFSPGPTVMFTTSRWRYWTDNLRTIGDHFRSVGGAQIKSLVAGEWIPVRRGT